MTSAPADKPALLARITDARTRLDAALASLGDGRMAEPIIDDWTAKDMLTHVALWERLISNAIEIALRGETPPWPELGMSIDQFDVINQREYNANRDLPLEEARRIYAEAYASTRALLDRLTERDLFDTQRFAWSEGNALSLYVRANTDEHYDEHAEQIEAWLAAHAGSAP